MSIQSDPNYISIQDKGNNCYEISCKSKKQKIILHIPKDITGVNNITFIRKIVETQLSKKEGWRDLVQGKAKIISDDHTFDVPLRKNPQAESLMYRLFGGGKQEKSVELDIMHLGQSHLNPEKTIFTEKEKKLASQIDTIQRIVDSDINCDFFLVKNDKNLDFPENLTGSIGIMCDAEMSTLMHKIISTGIDISSALKNVDIKSPFNKNDLVHAFVVLKNEQNSKSIRIAEAAGGGVKKNSLSLGEEGYTHLLIFKPKDEKLRNTIAINAAITTFGADQKDETDPFEVIPYDKKNAALAAIRQQFSPVTLQDKKKLSEAVTYLLQWEKIRENKNLKPLFCSQFAVLLMQTSYIISQLGEEKYKEFANMKGNAIEESIFKAISDPNSLLCQNIDSMKLFQARSGAILPPNLTEILNC